VDRRYPALIEKTRSGIHLGSP